MATDKVTPIRRKGGTPAYRAIADTIIYAATRDAFNKYFRAVAAKHPKGNSGVATKAYLDALRARLEWYERSGGVRS
jgi:hypothetical protein